MIRRQRMVFVAVLVVGVAVAAALAFRAIGENMLFFYSPSQLTSGEVPAGQSIKVGGLVVDGCGVDVSAGTGYEAADGWGVDRRRQTRTEAEYPAIVPRALLLGVVGPPQRGERSVQQRCSAGWVWDGLRRARADRPIRVAHRFMVDKLAGL